MFTALLAPLLWVVCGTRKLRKMQPFLALESSLEILPSLVWAVLTCCQAEVQGICSYYFLIDSCMAVPVLVLKCGEIAACLWLHGLWSQLGIIFFFFSFANTTQGAGDEYVCSSQTCKLRSHGSHMDPLQLFPVLLSTTLWLKYVRIWECGEEFAFVDLFWLRN